MDLGWESLFPLHYKVLDLDWEADLVLDWESLFIIGSELHFRYLVLGLGRESHSVSVLGWEPRLGWGSLYYVIYLSVSLFSINTFDNVFLINVNLYNIWKCNCLYVIVAGIFVS